MPTSLFKITPTPSDRIEPPRGGGADTALDDVEFQCCHAR